MMSSLLAGTAIFATLFQGGAWMELPALPLADRFPAMVGIGDFDGDQKRDVALGWSVGRVDLVSSVTGLTLGTISQPVLGSGFGEMLANVGDLDGDGIEDLAVSAFNESSGGLRSNGAVHFLALPSGRSLAVARGTQDFEQLGYQIFAAGDLDGDGVQDLLARSERPRQAIVALSGATGARLYQVTPLPPSSSLFLYLTVLGDLDGDSASEFAVGIPGQSNAQHTGCGWIGIYSGRNGGLLREIWGWKDYLALGARLAAAGDADRDGLPDLLAAIGRFNSAEPYAVVLSGRTGTPSFALEAESPSLGISFSIAGMLAGPDVDGDGRPDLLLWNPYARRPPDLGNGIVLIYDAWSGRLNGMIMGRQGQGLGQSLILADDLGLGPEPDLLATRYEGVPMVIGRYGYSDLITTSAGAVSAASGGTIHLRMEFPPEEAGRDYLILASASGSGPTNFGGLAVPLARDSLYDRMILAPPADFVGARGSFDAAASAQARLRLAPGAAAALVGRSLRFAAVSYEGVIARLSSRAVTVVVLP